MSTIYINPQAPIGHFFIDAVKTANLTLKESERGGRLTANELRVNLEQVVNYASMYITRIEVKTNPEFCPQFLHNYKMIAYLILKRELPKDSELTILRKHFGAVVSHIRNVANREFTMLPSSLDSWEANFREETHLTAGEEITSRLREIAEAVYSLLSMYISNYKNDHPDVTRFAVTELVKGALDGANLSQDYKYLLGGAICRTLIVKNFHQDDARLIFRDSIF